MQFSNIFLQQNFYCQILQVSFINKTPFTSLEIDKKVHPIQALTANLPPNFEQKNLMQNILGRIIFLQLHFAIKEDMSTILKGQKVKTFLKAQWSKLYYTTPNKLKCFLKTQLAPSESKLSSFHLEFSFNSICYICLLF